MSEQPIDVDVSEPKPSPENEEWQRNEQGELASLNGRLVGMQQQLLLTPRRSPEARALKAGSAGIMSRSMK